MLGESRRGSSGITSPSKPKATYQRSRNATPHTMSKCTDAKETRNVAEPDVCCPAQHNVGVGPIRVDRARAGSPNGSIGWRWLVWHRFSHKNRTQLPSRLQLHDSKRRLRDSSIFDSHRPLNFRHCWPMPANLISSLVSGGTLLA